MTLQITFGGRMAAGENGRLTRGQSKRRPTTTDRTTTDDDDNVSF